jgi:hypothetical protein
MHSICGVDLSEGIRFRDLPCEERPQERAREPRELMDERATVVLIVDCLYTAADYIHP